MMAVNRMLQEDGVYKKERELLLKLEKQERIEREYNERNLNDQIISNDNSATNYNYISNNVSNNNNDNLNRNNSTNNNHNNNHHRHNHHNNNTNNNNINENYTENYNEKFNENFNQNFNNNDNNDDEIINDTLLSEDDKSDYLLKINLENRQIENNNFENNLNELGGWPLDRIPESGSSSRRKDFTGDNDNDDNYGDLNSGKSHSSHLSSQGEREEDGERDSEGETYSERQRRSESEIERDEEEEIESELVAGSSSSSGGTKSVSTAASRTATKLLNLKNLREAKIRAKREKNFDKKEDYLSYPTINPSINPTIRPNSTSFYSTEYARESHDVSVGTDKLRG